MPSDAHTGKRLSCRFRSTCPSESILECSESHGMMAQQPALSQECSCCTWTCPTGEQVIPSVALHSFSCILYCPHWCLLHSITPCCADTAPHFWYTMDVSKMHWRITMLDTFFLWKLQRKWNCSYWRWDTISYFTAISNTIIFSLLYWSLIATGTAASARVSESLCIYLTRERTLEMYM